MLICFVTIVIFILNAKANIFSMNAKIFPTTHRKPPLITGGLRSFKEKWILQNVDHFDSKQTAKWKMRYMENNQYYKDGGPIFIFVGGESEISSEFIFAGHFHDVAKEHEGYLYCTEHRYYGKSYPTKDLSTENLKYLTTRQTLADLANFIRIKKQTVPGLANSKVILMGGSYSGSLVTWFRHFYPNLVAGVWASSAPLLAKMDFHEFAQKTGESIKLVKGDECYHRIKNGIDELRQMIEDRRFEEVKKMLKICDYSDLIGNSKKNTWLIFRSLSTKIANAIFQNGAHGIRDFCEIIQDGDRNITHLIASLPPDLDDIEKPCWNVDYQNYIENYSNTSLNGQNGDRQWIYQTCNEFGWFSTSNSHAEIFGANIPLELFLSICHDLFGENFTLEKIKRRICETNKNFGGFNPQVTNVYWTHGQLDPWKEVGVQDSSRTVIIPMIGHVSDLDSIGSSDSTDLRKSKEKIAFLIRKWIKSD